MGIDGSVPPPPNPVDENASIRRLSLEVPIPRPTYEESPRSVGLACHDEVAGSVQEGDEVVGAIRNPG